MATIAGNAAWAHLRAKDQLLLTLSGGGISGLPIFVTDDTPKDDLFTFARGSQPELICRHVVAFLAGTSRRSWPI
jgi:hypothetical protein